MGLKPEMLPRQKNMSGSGCAGYGDDVVVWPVSAVTSCSHEKEAGTNETVRRPKLIMQKIGRL